MSDGKWQKHFAGSFVDLPPNTVHAFINNTEEDVAWDTGWRPKGFQRFFQVFGISAHELQALERSVADDWVRNVENYGMYRAD